MASKSIIKVRIVGDNKDLHGSLDDSESAIGSWAGSVGKVAAAGLAAAGALAGVALSKGFSDALGLQDNDALIGARLGVTPERAAELGDIASAAYRDAWGDNLTEVTDVVTGLESSFDGLGNTDLERLTGQAIALGDAFEIDTAQGIQTASELMTSGLASSADEAFDLLTRGLQEMPQGIRDELFAASQEYGDFFADLGLSGDVAFAKLTEYADDGVYGIDKFGDALKELTIRGTDMSEASVSAYEAAGLSAEDMAARFLTGGATARTALEETAAGLLSIEDPVERANAAIALFGTPLEDLSVTEIPGFLDGLTDLSTGMGDVDGAATTMADTLGGTTSAKIEAFKREALGALADFAANELLPRFEQAVDWFQRNWPLIREIGQRVLDGLHRAWDRYGQPVFDAIVDAGQTVADWFIDNWPTIQRVVGAVLDALSNAFDRVREAIVATFSWLRDNQHVVAGIAAAVGTVLVAAVVAWTTATWAQVTALTAQAVAFAAAYAPLIAITAAIAAVVAAVVYAYQNWDTFRNVVDTVRDWMVNTLWPAIQTVADGIATAFGALVGFVQTHWDTIRTIIDTVRGWMVDIVWPAIQTVADGIATAFGALVGFVRTHWDTIQTIINTVVAAVRTYIETNVAIIRTAWETAWGAIKWVTDNIIAPIGSFLTDVLAVAIAAIGPIVDTVKTTWDTAWAAIHTVKNDVIDPIASFLTDTFSVAIDAIKTGINLLETAWGVQWAAMKLVWDNIITPIASFLSDVFTVAIDAIGTAIDAAKSVWDTAWGAIRSAASTAIDGIKTALGPLITLLETALSMIERVTDLNPFDGSFLGVRTGFNGSLDVDGIRNQSLTNVGLSAGVALANGGVATTPTLALIGEYPGARSNPEIVAPQSMMRDTVLDALREAGSPQIGMQVNGDVRLDDVGVETVARRINMAMVN